MASPDRTMLPLTPPLGSPRTLPFHIALAGPTAAGKSAAALAIARQHDAEIISVDSALVYRGMDIGTAKPSPEELAQVPHHLIDIRDPLHAYSAADFVRDANELIRDISARGKLPLLVGGTMLYFRALADGLDDMPAADTEVRRAIDLEAQQVGWPALHAKLAQFDPVTAARLSPNDSQRIQRAIEVYRISGRALTSFHADQPDDHSGAPASRPDDQGALISMEPADRAWLHARIAQRFDAMVAAGFMGEVRALRARGDLHLDLPSIRCVGYRQPWEALDGLWPIEELAERVIAATRQLAKRQITWLRSMPHRHIVACDQPDALEKVLCHVDSLVSQNHITGREPTP
jgi:tRNA dimethylallyltransferase